MELASLVAALVGSEALVCQPAEAGQSPKDRSSRPPVHLSRGCLVAEYSRTDSPHSRRRRFHIDRTDFVVEGVRQRVSSGQGVAMVGTDVLFRCNMRATHLRHVSNLRCQGHLARSRW